MCRSAVLAVPDRDRDREHVSLQAIDGVESKGDFTRTAHLPTAGDGAGDVKSAICCTTWARSDPNYPIWSGHHRTPKKISRAGCRRGPERPQPEPEHRIPVALLTCAQSGA